MKKVLFIAGMLSSILFFACTKTSIINTKFNESDSGDSSNTPFSDTTPYTPGPPVVQFVFNGAQIIVNSAEDKSRRDSVTGNYYGSYALMPSNSTVCSIIAEETNNAALLNIIVQNKALIGTYKGSLLSVYLFINSITFGTNSTSDGITVHVTRYGNGTIDGDFSGMVSDNTGNEKTVTQGKFINLQVN